MSNTATYIVSTAAAKLRAEPEREREITVEVLRALGALADPARVDYGCHVGAQVESYVRELLRARARCELVWVGGSGRARDD